MRGDAADPGVDLVEHQRLATCNRGKGEGDARELAAGCGLGHRAERQPRVRSDEKRDLVGAGRALLALAQLGEELPVAHPEAAELLGDGVGERTGTGPSYRAQLLGERAGACLRDCDGGGRRLDWVEPRFGLVELAPRVVRARQKLLERRAPEPALKVGDVREPALDVIQSAWIGLEG